MYVKVQFGKCYTFSVCVCVCMGLTHFCPQKYSFATLYNVGGCLLSRFETHSKFSLYTTLVLTQQKFIYTTYYGFLLFLEMESIIIILCHLGFNYKI